MPSAPRGAQAPPRGHCGTLCSPRSAPGRPRERAAGAAPGIADPVYEEPREQPGFLARRARLGRQAGAERVGLSMWEVGPGRAAYPYDYHLGGERAPQPQA